MSRIWLPCSRERQPSQRSPRRRNWTNRRSRSWRLQQFSVRSQRMIRRSRSKGSRQSQPLPRRTWMSWRTYLSAGKLFRRRTNPSSSASRPRRLTKMSWTHSSRRRRSRRRSQRGHLATHLCRRRRRKLKRRSPWQSRLNKMSKLIHQDQIPLSSNLEERNWIHSSLCSKRKKRRRKPGRGYVGRTVAQLFRKIQANLNSRLPSRKRRRRTSGRQRKRRVSQLSWRRGWIRSRLPKRRSRRKMLRKHKSKQINRPP